MAQEKTGVADDSHAMPAESVLARLASEAAGLDAANARQRLLAHGENVLASRPSRPAWLKFVDQFRNVLVLVLLAAAVLAGVVGDIKDSVVIVIVVLLNATLGFVQEHRAEAALAALKGMLAPQARVRRGGEVQLVAASELVPGDILLLEAGDRIPADARVLLAVSAEVAEAALTGESHAVAKQAGSVAADSVLAERFCMLYMNTVVTRGRLEAVVTATGMQTEMGRLAGLLAEAAESATPLQIQLDALGKRLALIAALVVGIIFVVGIARGDDLVQTIMTAIALAVAAIPEGLPAVVTVTLALGMHRMAGRNAIVKRLAAVETLGCTTVICSDKTGTLTLNQMTARKLYYCGQPFRVSGEGYDEGGEIVAATALAGGVDFRPLQLAATLCSDARLQNGELIGDPTEGALLALAAKTGLPAANMPRLAEIPFDSAHKFMATFHAEGEGVRIWLKGAPDVLLARATANLQPDGVAPLDEAQRAAFVAENQAMAGEAMRVLALATRLLTRAEFEATTDLTVFAEQLVLLGLIGIIDPPRPEAREAIAQCHRAGIAVKMITGDHAVTAAAIARDLGLTGEVHEGRELDGLDEASLAAMVARTAVFARVSPTHKLQIVAALRQQGEVVAMTGDGVNDAPALKTADIGVAMGITGTEVSKEAATLVLTDDNFASIVGAVREGRTIYDNIVKFVRFQLSTNIGAILTVLGAPLFGFPTPFTAIQILWVNIIMDGPPAMTLGVEQARPGIMQDKPRAANSNILTGQRLLRLLAYGATMAAATLAAYGLGQAQGEAYALTMAFTTFVLCQFFNIFNARAEHGSAFNSQFFANGKLWLALLGVVGLQVLVVHWAPAQAVFDTVDLQAQGWLTAAGLASSVLLLDEARKLLQRLLMRG